MSNRVYVIPLSNPAATGVAMVAHKRIPHRVVSLMPGLHPYLLRAAGFGGATVPALELDGRKIQGTLAISRALELARPDPPLFPADAELRSHVEAAERWGEAELQPLPRRVFRFALLRDRELRRWMAGEVMGLPAPAVAAELSLPLVRRLAAVSHAEESAVRSDLARMPALLDEVDRLVSETVIGRAAPNAADFQILSSVRVMLEFQTLAHEVEGRPCDAAARRLYPRWLGPIPRTAVLDPLRVS
jgi:glutathione S-transferase